MTLKMVNLWICLSKNFPDLFAPDDLGLFIAEPGVSPNDKIYLKLRAAGSHFSLQRPGQFVDNTYVGGPIILFKEDTLVRRAFPFEAGTSIIFNSHFLHGTQRSKSGATDLQKGTRTSLTSVWVHKEDFKPALATIETKSYENVYFSQHSSVEKRIELKRWFPDACRNQERAMQQISALVRHHLAGTTNPDTKTSGR